MSTVMFQFHATGEEVIELAAIWALEHGFAIAVEQFWPEYRVALTTAQEARSTIERVDRVAVGPDPFVVSVDKAHEFVGSNPGHLFMLVERPMPNGLHESAISGATQDQELIRLWRRLIRTERERMHKGATVRSFDGAQSAPMPNHRHTSGAHELALQGVRMLAAGGGNEIVFDDLDAKARPGG